MCSTESNGAGQRIRRKMNGIFIAFPVTQHNISVNTFSFMNDTNLIERCQAEEGGVRDQTGRLQILTVEERRGFSWNRRFWIYLLEHLPSFCPIKRRMIIDRRIFGFSRNPSHQTPTQPLNWESHIFHSWRLPYYIFWYGGLILILREGSNISSNNNTFASLSPNSIKLGQV